MPEPTPQQKAKYEELRKDLSKVVDRYRELVGKLFGPRRPKSKEDLEALRKEFEATTNNWSFAKSA